MSFCGGGLCYAEPLRQGDPTGDGVAFRVGACPDLALQYPRNLEVSRDTGKVIKIIRHTVSLDGLVRLAALMVSLDDLDSLARYTPT
jgi:hypothetical protein